MKLAIVIPVLNDWSSLRVLVPRISAELDKLGATAIVVAIDDGSTEPPGAPPVIPLNNLSCEVVRLGTNLGHQRAIVVGLAYVHEHHDVDALIVMDADGEDRPDDLAIMINAFRQNPAAIISAKRGKRSEGPVFRIGYLTFKFLHRALTAKTVQGGNYSLVPYSRLNDLLHCTAIWQHYAAGILSSRLPVVPVDTDRGTRIDGQSRMNLVSLIVHGITAISVFDRIAFVRVLIASLAGMSVAAIGIIIVVAVHLFTELSIPGWVPYATGILGILFVQLSTLSALLVSMLLQTRSGTPFLPSVDALRYVVQSSPWENN